MDESGKKLLLTLHTPADHVRSGKQWSRWAKITSPHVVRLHDVICSEDGRWALVQEEIRGQTLAMHCETRSELLRLHGETLIKQIRQGVQALHDVGIVHGDLTPRNILVAEGPRAVIIDLLESAQREQLSPSSDQRNLGEAAQEEDTGIMASRCDMDSDDDAVEELMQRIREAVHAPVQAVALMPEDPGARLRAQAKLPVTQIHRKRSRHFPLKWRRISEKRVSAVETPSLDQPTYEGERQDFAQGQESWKGSRKTHFPAIKAVASQHHLQAVSPTRIVLVGAVVASLLGGWGTLQLWIARADGPILSPQAGQEMQTQQENSQSEKNWNAPQSGTSDDRSIASTAPLIQATRDSDTQTRGEKNLTNLVEEDDASQCPNEDMVSARLNAILHARDTAYIKQDLSELELYLSPELITEERKTVDAMRSKQTKVEDFHTILTSVQHINCHDSAVHAEVRLAVDAYTVCDPQKCVDVAATPPPQDPLHLVLSVNNLILLSVNPVVSAH